MDEQLTIAIPRFPLSASRDKNPIVNGLSNCYHTTNHVCEASKLMGHIENYSFVPLKVGIIVTAAVKRLKVKKHRQALRIEVLIWTTTQTGCRDDAAVRVRLSSCVRFILRQRPSYASVAASTIQRKHFYVRSLMC